jgi:hemin uptake protein HemP
MHRLRPLVADDRPLAFFMDAIRDAAALEVGFALVNGNEKRYHSRKRLPEGAKRARRNMVSLDQSNAPEGAAATEAALDRSVIRRIDARDLFAGRREVRIVHAGREYRLRVTSNGKLILTA